MWFPKLREFNKKSSGILTDADVTELEILSLKALESQFIENSRDMFHISWSFWSIDGGLDSIFSTNYQQ